MRNVGSMDLQDVRIAAAERSNTQSVVSASVLGGDGGFGYFTHMGHSNLAGRVEASWVTSEGRREVRELQVTVPNFFDDVIVFEFDGQRVRVLLEPRSGWERTGSSSQPHQPSTP